MLVGRHYTLFYTVHTRSPSLFKVCAYVCARLCMWYGLVYEYLFKRFDQRSASPLTEHECMPIEYSNVPSISFSCSRFSLSPYIMIIFLCSFFHLFSSNKFNLKLPLNFNRCMYTTLYVCMCDAKKATNLIAFIGCRSLSILYMCVCVFLIFRIPSQGKVLESVQKRFPQNKFSTRFGSRFTRIRCF